MKLTKGLMALLAVVIYGLLNGGVLADTISKTDSSSPVVGGTYTGTEVFGSAVKGTSNNGTGSDTIGVYGMSYGSEGMGVRGFASGTNAYGVYGRAVGSNSYGVYCEGNFMVTGSFEHKNLASSATVTASSEFNDGYKADNVKDGIINRWNTGEWSSDGEGAGAWVQLTWGSAQTIGEVWLYDRPNKYDQIEDAWLQIDEDGDGTAEHEIHLGMFPYGGAPKKVYLTEEEGSSVKALKVYIIDVKESTQNVGLSEIMCFK